MFPIESASQKLHFWFNKCFAANFVIRELVEGHRAWIWTFCARNIMCVSMFVLFLFRIKVNWTTHVSGVLGQRRCWSANVEAILLNNYCTSVVSFKMDQKNQTNCAAGCTLRWSVQFQAGRKWFQQIDEIAWSWFSEDTVPVCERQAEWTRDKRNSTWWPQNVCRVQTWEDLQHCSIAAAFTCVNIKLAFLEFLQQTNPVLSQHFSVFAA